LPAPWEEIDGVVYQYFNNPAVFVQPHISLFQMERRHYERHPMALAFGAVNLRWLQAEDWYARWVASYTADEWAKQTAKGSASNDAANPG
jgi:hypothetical protein